MNQHNVVSHEEWLAARLELLQEEKEFSKRREELTQKRRDLPWRKIEKTYEFDGPDGKESLADLFGSCRQMIIYHFMFGPEWSEGCKICSMFGDHYDPLDIHLRQRDVSLVTVSRAPYAQLREFQRRMNWRFKWVSSFESDFNWDFNVSFDQADLDAGNITYNYKSGTSFPMAEAPGISSFYKDDSGAVFHTYSAYSRGLENFLGIYNFLDIVPRGRDENSLPFSMAWVRHKDRYDETL